MAKKPTKADLSLLASIVAAMANPEAPFMFVTPSEAQTLLDNELIEVNSEITDGDKVAARATEKGQATAPAPSTNEGNTNTVTETTTTAAASAPKPTFELEDNIAKPEGRAPRMSAIYPFEHMGVGQSFHVAATDDKPNPAKSLASTVSSANKRFAKAGQDGRKFSVKTVGETDPKGKGARVWRDS